MAKIIPSPEGLEDIESLIELEAPYEIFAGFENFRSILIKYGSRYFLIGSESTRKRIS